MSYINWEIPDDINLPDIFEQPEEDNPNQKGRKQLGWVKYKFTDRISGTIHPWELTQEIADVWEKCENPIHFYNQKNLTVKIGSLILFGFKSDNEIKKIKNKFLLWNLENGKSFLAFNEGLLEVENRNNLPKGILFTVIRWNYRANYLMIKRDNSIVSDKHFVMILQNLWERIFNNIEVDKADVICLTNQMLQEVSNQKIGEIFYKSLNNVFNKSLEEMISFFRHIRSWQLDRAIWNWGGIKMSPINFARWLSEIDNCQPLINSQQDVDVWKDCLIRLPLVEVENTLKLLKAQNASIKQISAVEVFLV